MLAADMKSGMNVIRSVADELGWRVFVHYLSSQATHVGFYSKIYPKRFVLVIELFAGGVWRGQQFLSAKRILKMRLRHGCTWKPHPAHEAIITLVHHLLYNGRVFERYRSQIRSCVEQAPGLFEAELRRPFGRKRAKNILEFVKSNDWNELERQAAQTCRSFLSRSLCLRPFQSTRAIIRLCADYRRKPEGIVISIESTSSRDVEPIADAIIELAVRWHIFVPPTRKKIVFSCSDASVVREVKSVIASGGIAVILKTENRCLPLLSLQHPLVRVNVHEEMTCISIGERSTSCSGTHETLAFDIWNTILRDRSDELVRE
jgi:hypothetical protein